ncbi:MAG: TetR/AcrR family transcriptional regulator [Polyangiales bacterium]
MKDRKPDNSVEHIVHAALRVLARQGYARTSLMDIAREAEMSKGAVHYHFPSKESLMADVLQTACDAVAARTRAAWKADAPPLTAIEQAIAMLWQIRVERSDEAVVVADLLAQSLYDEGLRPQLARYFAFAAEQVKGELEPRLAAFGLRPRLPPALMARMLIGLLDGLVMQAYADPQALSTEAVLSALSEIAGALVEWPSESASKATDDRSPAP